jgi:hypothetical protein
MFRAIIVLMLLPAAALLEGADAKSASNHQRTPAHQSMANAARSDAQIEAAIRAKLGGSKINEDHFQVHVQGGVATLEGKTDVVQHKGVATRLAKSAGATAVQNRIQISEAARQKAAANLEAGRRRAQIKRGEPRSEASARGGTR